MICVICNNSTNKYKCPRCLEPYCSLTCFKKHKEQVCEVRLVNTEVVNNEEPTIHDPFKTDDTVPKEKLELLRECQPLHQLLYNHHLGNLLREIDTAPNAWKAISAAMQEPLFVEFADECLKVIEPNIANEVINPK